MSPQESWDAHTSREFAREWFWSRHDRDEYECPDCGRGIERVQRFEVHHKDADPTNNDPSNLVALCKRCHVWRHDGGPTVSGLDVEEWKQAFAAGEDSINSGTLYDPRKTTEMMGGDSA